MKNIFKQRGQILIIYLTTLFVGGSSLALGILATGKPIKELEKGVKAHVLDSDRQIQSLALLDKWNDQGESLRQEYQQQRERLLDLIKDHDAKLSSFETEMKQLLAMDESTATTLLDIQYELRNSLTRSEWKNIMSDQ